jgi:hypothetical protein
MYGGTSGSLVSSNLIIAEGVGAMSGSGGGYGGGFEDDAPSCADLDFETQLGSPKEDVISKVNVGDVLALRTRQSGTMTLVEALYHGEVAGGIASPKIGRLRECLAQGFNYGATVTARNGGQVTVRISVVKTN